MCTPVGQACAGTLTLSAGPPLVNYRLNLISNKGCNKRRIRATARKREPAGLRRRSATSPAAPFTPLGCFPRSLPSPPLFTFCYVFSDRFFLGELLAPFLAGVHRLLIDLLSALLLLMNDFIFNGNSAREELFLPKNSYAMVACADVVLENSQFLFCKLYDTIIFLASCRRKLHFFARR